MDIRLAYRPTATDIIKQHYSAYSKLLILDSFVLFFCGLFTKMLLPSCAKVQKQDNK